MQQLDLFSSQIVGAPYQASSDTSIAAAVAAAPKVKPQSQKILGALRIHGPMTQDEVAVTLYLPRSTVCARMRELELEGFVVKTNETRLTQYGKAAAVYRLAEGRTK